MSNLFGPTLYNERSVYNNAQTAHALSLMFPDQENLPRFENPVLAVYANAIWNCGSAAEVCTVNQAAATQPKFEHGANEEKLVAELGDFLVEGKAKLNDAGDQLHYSGARPSDRHARRVKLDGLDKRPMTRAD